jgi:hypothetical protein
VINHPITFHRDFRNDFLPLNPQEEGIAERCKKVALATLPLLGLHRPFRGPLSVGMSCLRTATHAFQMMENFKRGDIQEGSFHLLNASLATASIALFFFNPIYCFLFSSVSDLIMNFRTCIEYVREGNYQKALESMVFMTLDLLFLASFCYGAIEVTVGCMILQILINLHLSADHFKKGHYFEGVCQALLGGAHLHQVFPQLKVLQWKWQNQPSLSAELKQDDRGFVYLDIPDEHVNTLFQLCDEAGAELPPYFGKGMAGAHVSVISSDEMRAGLTIADVGKKFNFRIVNADAIRPSGWKGVDKVWYLTLDAPELESLRVRNGFSPRISDHDFHLTFGIKRAPALAKI